MDAGGWSLLYNWLKDAVKIDNTKLIHYILEIFYIAPVTTKLLGHNSGEPILVKKLYKNHSDMGNCFTKYVVIVVYELILVFDLFKL